MARHNGGDGYHVGYPIALAKANGLGDARLRRYNATKSRLNRRQFLT